ncbi:hypothetical protein PFLmoz3_04294 [Pseudomonas fluorescens]|uniref:Uncharacterized protein n=1 Tax=Pseudomonas fluorescens TaxID=294 RepID=A0A109LEK4_PSEFL|nr:hypothetical protein PFLmoz3_04294 [Pseudomonas fluorescens]
MQGEVIRVDTQLTEFIGGDQQVQRQLLVTQVEANDLRQELVGAHAKRQLQRALQVMVILQAGFAVGIVLAEQLAVDHHMVLRGFTVAQFFQVSGEQAVEALVLPIAQQAIEPGAVDLFGGCHALQKVQRMGLVLKIPTWPPLLALLKVVGIGLGHLGAALLDPGRQLFGPLWQVAVGGLYQGQLIVQVFTRQFGGVLGFAMQLLVDPLMAALGRVGERGRLA